MNRSQRCAAVIRGAIAAGLLCAAFGITAVVPAVADAGGDDGGSIASNHHGHSWGEPSPADGESSGTPPRRGPRAPMPPSDAEKPEWHPHHWPWPWPCHIVWPVLPAVQVYTGNRNRFILPQGPTMPALTTVLSGVGETGEHASTVISGAAPDAPEAAPPAAGPADTPAAGLSGRAASVPAALPEVPAAPPSPSRGPETVAAAPNPPTTGPPGMPSANLGQIAALALPGLAGIAALTALGGFLGYRQAKAGYVLRAAGPGRFLQ